jgi:hypothetical protein
MKYEADCTWNRTITLQNPTNHPGSGPHLSNCQTYARLIAKLTEISVENNLECAVNKPILRQQ